VFGLVQMSVQHEVFFSTHVDRVMNSAFSNNRAPEYETIRWSSRENLKVDY
jgi:hypothetical protein